jgi:hypothetical protein
MGVNMRSLVPLVLVSMALAGPARAEQDLLLGADMNTPAMTRAEMSRADIEASTRRTFVAPT